MLESWKSKRVGCLFDKEDVLGNKVMTMSGLGLYSQVRYVNAHGAVYFNVKDIMETFCMEDVASIWEQLGEEVRNEFLPRLLIHAFKTDDVQEGVTFDMFAMYYNDIIKLLGVLPLSFVERSQGIDTFIMYYQINFRLLKEFTVHNNKCCLSLSDCYYHSLILIAMMLGFLFACIVFLSCNLLKT